jgi:hypothetical protein
MGSLTKKSAGAQRSAGRVLLGFLGVALRASVTKTYHGALQIVRIANRYRGFRAYAG